MELINQRLIHSKFGKGTVYDYASNIIVVQFDSGETKNLSCLYALPFIKLENEEIDEELRNYVEQQSKEKKSNFEKNILSKKLVSVDKKLSTNVINENLILKN